MNSKCDYDFLNKTFLSDKEFCELVFHNCSHLQTTINFFTLKACYVRNRFLIGALLSVLLFFAFKLLYDAVKFYMAPALLFFSRLFGLSQSMAGVTLLAFASGIGDIAMAFVASKSDEAVPFIVGSLFGSALFVVTVVIAVAIQITPRPVKIAKSIILRDLGFLAFGTLVLLGFGWTGSITTAKAAFFFSIYFAVVFVVFAQENIICGGKRAVAEGRTARRALSSRLSWEESSFSGNFDHSVRANSAAKLKSFAHNNSSLHFPYEDSSLRSLAQSIKNPLLVKLYGALQAVGLPTVWALQATVPPCSARNFDAVKLILWPYFGIPLLLLAALGTPRLCWLWYLPFALVVSLAFHRCLQCEAVYKSLAFGALVSALSTVAASAWIKIVSAVLIDAVVFLGTDTGLPPDVLAFSVISTGNALPDALITLELARRGQGVMAVTGAYAGQVFGILFGFGIAMLKRCRYLRGEVRFDLFGADGSSYSRFCLPLIAFCLLSVVITVVFLLANDFNLGRGLRNALFCTYLLFIAYTVTDVWLREGLWIFSKGLLHALK